jgi:hypothetical protein
MNTDNQDICSNGVDGLSQLNGTFALNFDSSGTTKLQGSFSGSDVITGSYSH